MKKTPKNIPSPYKFPGTPIFRDTTALPFASGGFINPKGWPPPTSKGISISDPDEYAYRKGMYDDSLKLHQLSYNQMVNLNKLKTPLTNISEGDLDDFKLNKKQYVLENVYSPSSEKLKKITPNITEVQRFFPEQNDFYHKKIKPTKSYDSGRSSLNFLYKKPTQPVSFQPNNNPTSPIKNKVNSYTNSKTNVAPTLNLEENSKNEISLKTKPLQEINLKESEIVQSNNKLKPKANQSDFAFRQQAVYGYNPDTKKFDIDSLRTASLPYAERYSKGWETNSLQDIPESGPRAWTINGAEYYNQEDANAAAKQYEQIPSYNFADGGPLNDKTNHGEILNSVYASALGNYYNKGGMLKRADGSYSPRGLWDNIRANAGSGKAPTKEMLAQERKINSKPNGGPINTSGPRNITESEIIPQGTEMSPDYDLKRFYTENPMGAESFMAGQGHATDQYKLPNHPTFSSGSMYSTTDNPGGDWEQNPDGTWNFNASQVNRNNMSEAEMKQYFNEVEPGNTIKYKDGGQFQGKYSLPEDSFRQGGKNLHDSIYASSPQQYPGIYNLGGNLDDRQQMYMPLDHVTRNGGSILSMSNTPEMSGEGKDLTYPENSYAYDNGGPLYTYAGRPGAQYQKDVQGNWLINTSGGTDFTPIKDPTGKRSAILNKNATIYTNPAKFKREYDPLLDVTAAIGDNTKVQTTNKAVPVTDMHLKTEKEKSDERLAAMWAEGNKQRDAHNPAIDPQTGKLRPMSAGEADWVWSLPTAGSAGLKAAGAIGGMALPGMASVPGATVGNLVNSGFIANSLYNTPENVESWYDVSQGNKDWKEAALESGEIAAGMIGSGSGLKSLGQDIVQGTKGAKNLYNDAIIPTSNTLDKLKKVNSFAGELAGSFKPGRTKTLREAENWTKNWVQHPATQEKIINSYKEGLKLPVEGYVFKKAGEVPNAKHNLEEAIKFSSGYNPTGRLKEYPLLNQLMEYPKPNIHKGNTGVSYTHSDIPGQFIKNENTFVAKGELSPLPSFDIYPNALDAVPAFKRHGNWISRTLDPDKRLSSGVHELGHDWVKDKTLKVTDQENIIKDAIDNSYINNVKKAYPNDAEIHEGLDYLAKPTEIHARLMEARKYFNLTPDQVVTPDQADYMLTLISAGKTPINSQFPSIIKENGKSGADLFNKVWGIVPAAGIAGGAALANPWQEKPKGL